MYSKYIKANSLIGLFLCLTTIALSQPPRGPFVVSPQVLPDKKVTFRYLAPSAKEVNRFMANGNISKSNFFINIYLL